MEREREVDTPLSLSSTSMTAYGYVSFVVAALADDGVEDDVYLGVVFSEWLSQLRHLRWQLS